MSLFSDAIHTRFDCIASAILSTGKDLMILLSDSCKSSNSSELHEHGDVTDTGGFYKRQSVDGVDGMSDYIGYGCSTAGEGFHVSGFLNDEEDE